MPKKLLKKPPKKLPKKLLKELPEYKFRVLKPHEEKRFLKWYKGITPKRVLSYVVKAAVVHGAAVLPLIPTHLAATEALEGGHYSATKKMVLLGGGITLSLLALPILRHTKALQELVSEDTKHIVVETEGKQVGSVCMLLSRRRKGKRIVRAHALYMHKNHRKKGVATRMVYHAAKHLEKIAREDPETEYYLKGSLVAHPAAAKLLKIAKKGKIFFKPIKIEVGSPEWKGIMKELKKKAASYSSTS